MVYPCISVTLRKSLFRQKFIKRYNMHVSFNFLYGLVMVFMVLYGMVWADLRNRLHVRAGTGGLNENELTS